FAVAADDVPEAVDLGEFCLEQFGDVLAVAAEVAAEDDGVDRLIGQQLADEARVHGQVLLPRSVEIERIVDAGGLGQVGGRLLGGGRVEDLDGQAEALGRVRGDGALTAGVGDDGDPSGGRKPGGGEEPGEFDDLAGRRESNGSGGSAGSVDRVD